MNGKMLVTLLQTDIKWGASAENIRSAEQLINSSQPSDLYVLPEMWSTGFATNPEGIAHEEDTNEALIWMRTIANERHCAICGSLAIHLSDNSYRNRHYFIDGRNHQEVFYDKHHLFTYGGEDKYYTPGQSHVVVVYEGFRILLLTCYDLRFPCWSRYADDREYDIIVVVANPTTVPPIGMADPDTCKSYRESGILDWCQQGGGRPVFSLCGSQLCDRPYRQDSRTVSLRPDRKHVSFFVFGRTAKETAKISCPR